MENEKLTDEIKNLQKKIETNEECIKEQKKIKILDDKIISIENNLEAELQKKDPYKTQLSNFSCEIKKLNILVQNFKEENIDLKAKNKILKELNNCFVNENGSIKVDLDKK